MNLDKLREFQSVRKNEEELYIAVGSIVLTLDANLSDYMLATISVLNRLKGGSIRDHLDDTIDGVDHYGLWEENSSEKRIFTFPGDRAYVGHDIDTAYFDILRRELIDRDSSGITTLTDRGLHALRNVMPEEDLSRVDA